MKLQIRFRFLSWWRVATGEGQSGTVDTLCARDPDGLPYVPARQVRGLFREAVRDAEGLEWITEPMCEKLFGSRTRSVAAPGDDSEPARVYRRVIGLNFKQLYHGRSGFHRMSPRPLRA